MYEFTRDSIRSLEYRRMIISESHLIMDQRQRSCTLLLRLASTIATQSMQGRRSPKTVADKLQRVLNAGARVVMVTHGRLIVA